MEREVHLLSFLNRLYDSQSPQMQFSAGTSGEWRTWRKAALERLREILTFPAIAPYAWRDAPSPIITDRAVEEDHTRERVLIPTLDRLWMPCFLLIPHGPAPHPAVLCLHGHGMSKHILAGVPRTASEQELINTLRGDYALKFVRAGFLTLVPDAAGYGERTEEKTEAGGGGACQHIFVNALSLGLSLQGIRVWECLKALEYLIARPDVQTERVAAAGLSMGCEHSMYVAALDDRVQAAVLSCCVRAIIPDAKRISWCPCLFSPGLFTAMDWPDIAALIAPRPVQLQFGDSDYVPLALAREAHGLLARAYKLSGASADSLDYDEFSGKHEFHFEAALPFITRCLDLGR